MPKLENNKVEKEKETKNEVVTKNDELDKLKKENEELKEKMREIIDMMKQKENTISVQHMEEDKIVEKIYDEPHPNKSIKIISMYYGYLNLSDGKGSMLSFSKYGEVKNCMYNKLIDIVNNNLKFAEQGYFYIADESAVYYLGLSDYYKKIQTKDVLDNICNYDDVVIINIGNMLSEEQKNTVAFGLAQRKYFGEKLDLNKIEVLSKAIGINILAKESEMRETEMNKNQSNN